MFKFSYLELNIYIIYYYNNNCVIYGIYTCIYLLFLFRIYLNKNNNNNKKWEL
jgi:hypothetical protein